MPERRSMLDLVESFYLAQTLVSLHEVGALDALPGPRPTGSAEIPAANVDDLSAQLGLERELLRMSLEFLVERTDLIVRASDGYARTDAWSTHNRFLFDQYLGAYRPNALALARLIRDSSGAGEIVDRERHATAFDRLGRPALPALVDLLRQLDLRNILDIGCGPGSLLVELAQRDPTFVGWGLDASAAMLRSARARAADADVADRVSFFEGECVRIAELLPESVLATVQTVTAASLLNELFGAGPDAAVAFLVELRRALPGRTLVVVDYYGHLGFRPDPGGEAALHDFVQCISGQGVPPPDLAGWLAVYEPAGCKVLHVVHDHSSSGFVHLLRL